MSTLTSNGSNVLQRLIKAHPAKQGHASEDDCPVCKLIVELQLEEMNAHETGCSRLPTGTKVRLTGPLFPGSPRTGWEIENIDEPRDLKYRVRHPNGSLCDVLAECVVVDEPTSEKASEKSFAGVGPDDAEFGSAEWRRDNPEKANAPDTETSLAQYVNRTDKGSRVVREYRKLMERAEKNGGTSDV